MKKLLLIAVSLFIMPLAFAQVDAETQALLDKMKPGYMHSMLASYDGEWKVEATYWTEPSTPPIKHEYEMISEMIMDGRYQRSVYKGDFQGIQFIGESVTGYDNTRKMFINTLIANTNTGMQYSEGSYDPTAKAINYTVTNQNVRAVHTFVDDNTQKQEVYLTENGKEKKVIEYIFTRM